MELILESFRWCDEGIRSGIDPGDRVSGDALEEEEERIIKIKTNVKKELHKY